MLLDKPVECLSAGEMETCLPNATSYQKGAYTSVFMTGKKCCFFIGSATKKFNHCITVFIFHTV